jgi:hypothetical protein
VNEAAERRKAKNEAIFREANEKIREARVELIETQGPTPFLCECSDTDCREVVLLDLLDYEFARADAKRFVIAAGHSTDGADVVRAGSGYAIVTKDGAAGEVTEATDPRTS